MSHHIEPYSEGASMEPSSMASMMSWAGRPSTWRGEWSGKSARALELELSRPSARARPKLQTRDASERDKGRRTVAPTDWAVPRISLAHEPSEVAYDLGSMIRAMFQISSSGMLPECLTFFSFLRSRGGSLRALMTSDEAEGTTEATA